MKAGVHPMWSLVSISLKILCVCFVVWCFFLLPVLEPTGQGGFALHVLSLLIGIGLCVVLLIVGIVDCINASQLLQKHRVWVIIGDVLILCLVIYLLFFKLCV